MVNKAFTLRLYRHIKKERSMTASVTPMQNSHRHTGPSTVALAKEPLDRRGMANAVLQSVGEAVYEWDVLTDQMIWSEGAADLLCIP
ncbi:MAG: hypothetical protein AAFQ10_16155 [Pseudomonadota bacterium]